MDDDLLYINIQHPSYRFHLGRELRCVFFLGVASLGNAGELDNVLCEMPVDRSSAPQTIYDVKYYTNDWFHRILFICQLGVYASLAAFSGSFNVGWEINSDTMNIFTGNVTALTAEAITTDEENSMIQSFRGVNFILSISRILLLIQYLRGRSLRSLGVGCVLIANFILSFSSAQVSS